MQLKEQINKIELICKENKIKIYRDFQATCASANFTDAAYKVLRDKLVPNIYNILYNEFNGKGKISSKAKKSILTLSKLSVKLKKSDSKKAQTIDSKIDKIIEQFSFDNNSINLKKPIISYLDLTLNGIGSLLNEKKDENYAKAFEEIKEALIATKDLVLSSIDNSSKEAANYESSIFDSITEIRRLVGSNQFLLGDAKRIGKEMVEVAKAWESSNLLKSKKAKDKDYKEVDFPVGDKFEELTSIQNYKEKIEMFAVKINDFDNYTKQAYNAEKEEEKVSECESKIHENTNKIKEILSQMKEKRIDEIKATHDADRLDKENKRLESIIRNSNKKIDHHNFMKDKRDNISIYLKNVIEILQENLSNPNILSYMLKKINLGEIDGLLSGSLTEEQVVTAMFNLKQSTEFLKKTETQIIDAEKTGMKINNNMWQVFEEDEEEVEETKVNKNKLNDLVSKYGLSTSQEEDEVNEDQIDDVELQDLLR